MNMISQFQLRDLPYINNIAVISINFITTTLLLAVFNHNKLENMKSKLFGLMAIFILLWVDFAYAARLFGNYLFLSEIFLRVAWVATPLLFYIAYLLSAYLAKKQIQQRILSRILLTLSVISGILIAFTNLIIKGVTFTNTTLDIVYGVLFYPFLVIILILMVSTIIPILKSKMNLGAKIFLMGIVIFYLANIIFNITLPVFLGITHLYYIGDYSTIILLGFTVYSVLRHELFDVRVVVSEMLIVLIWFVVLLKIMLTSNSSFVYVDVIELGVLFIVGVLLIKSVVREVEQKRRLEELTRKLRELDERKDEFLSIVAHELRAPLTAVKGYVSMILDGDAGEVDNKVKDFLYDVTNSNDRMIRLVNNMLDMSRIEENRIVFQLDDINLREILESVHREFKFESERSGVTLNLEIPENISDFARVDKDRLHEVVSNLVSNAIKYTEKGYVTIRASNPTPTTVRVDVVDTGRGIPLVDQKNLFQKFYRAESERDKSTGTGLGLYVSKLLIEKFNGKMFVNSVEGKGSTFSFELPLRLAK